jgi:ATP-binding cassette subfamily B protein
VLRDIDLEIPKGARVGFMGITGSGKSTLLDILMALLPPGKGSLVIDDIVINEQNFRNWQSHIAHVPQSIFLADTTIAENIAFGVPADHIDYQRIETAAQQAQIAKSIESWEKGYNTIVGERGVRLSGGQRQRIGIARALYKQADVIVFDEATSALDNETEAAVIDAIDTMSNGITVLMVAHRLSTLKVCDVIYELEASKIKRSGTYREIISDAKVLAIR